MLPAPQRRHQKSKRGIAGQVPHSPIRSEIDSTAALDYRS
jgi:hypothetical protein